MKEMGNIMKGESKRTPTSVTIEDGLLEYARNNNINLSEIINEAIRSKTYIETQQVEIINQQDKYGLRNLGLNPNYVFGMWERGEPHSQTLQKHVEEAFDKANSIKRDEERYKDEFERDIRWCATRMKRLGVENADNLKQIKLENFGGEKK